jgi:hypothetical protein
MVLQCYLHPYYGNRKVVRVINAGMLSMPATFPSSTTISALATQHANNDWLNPYIQDCPLGCQELSN